MQAATPAPSLGRMEVDSAAETICRAIANRHRLTFKCGEGTCVVEPHQLGRDASGGLVLLAYLVEGEPALAGVDPGGGERWRVYRVADFAWALEGDETFEGPRPGYEPALFGAVSAAVCRL